MPLGDSEVVLGGRSGGCRLQQVAPVRGHQRLAGWSDPPELGERAGAQQFPPRLLVLAERALLEGRPGQLVRGAQHFERAPAGTDGEDLAGRGVGVRQPGGVRGLDRVPGQGALQTALDLRPRGLPVGPVRRLRAHGQRPVRLQPGDVALGLQPDVFELGAGESGLDLAVPAGPRLGEPLLPAPPAGPRSPDEEFAAAQDIGGRLDQPLARLVDRGDPAAPPVGHLVEVVGGEGAVERVGPVGPVVRRHGHPAQASLVAEVPGLLGRGDHPALLGDRDVGPPVQRGGLLVRVADADADIQEVRAVRQPQIDLEGEVTQAFPLPQAQHLAAARGGDAGRVDG